MIRSIKIPRFYWDLIVNLGEPATSLIVHVTRDSYKAHCAWLKEETKMNGEMFVNATFEWNLIYKNCIMFLLISIFSILTPHNEYQNTSTWYHLHNIPFLIRDHLQHGATCLVSHSRFVNSHWVYIRVCGFHQGWSISLFSLMMR